MAALMCVDTDLSDTVEEGDTGEDDTKLSAEEIVAREVIKAEEGDAARWLELDELGIDDAMLSSLDLPRKFPV